MPRLNIVVSKEVDDCLRAHATRYKTSIKHLVESGIPLAIEAHKRQIMADAKGLSEQGVKASLSKRKHATA